MGAAIGGIIGGVGSLLGGSSSDKQVSKNALTGYNYLTSGQGSDANNGYVSFGNNANNAQADLLGLSNNPHAQDAAFSNFRNSTGYNFLMDQGSRAITGSAAAKGILNSGATAKALTQFGQNLADTSFQNYFNNITDVSKQGQAALQMTSQAGTQGGGAAASALTSGNATQGASGLGGFMGSLGNFFGGL